MKTLVIALIISHFISDWILQPREIAKTKSNDLKSLSTHLLIVYLGMLATTWLFTDFSYYHLILLNCINIATHGLIDWNVWTLAKKWLDRYEGDKKEYLFYSTIAVDQSLHLVILMALFL